MDRSSLNTLTLEKAAELLAVRREASRVMGGLVKCSLDLEQLKSYLAQAGGRLKDVWNAKPDTASLSQPGGSGDYWKAVGQESLRNALLGGVGGAGIGALKGLITGDDVLGDAITGGLAGGTLGGLGTAAYRGFDAGSAPNQSDSINAAERQQIEDRKNSRSVVEQSKGLAQEHLGLNVDAHPASKAVADGIEAVMPNTNSDARQLGYGAHVAGGAGAGYGLGLMANRLMLPRTIRQNFSVLKPNGDVPSAVSTAGTATGDPLWMTSQHGMDMAKGKVPPGTLPPTAPATAKPSRFPRFQMFADRRNPATYRPPGVSVNTFNKQINQAQGWRKRMPMGLGLLGAGLGAMEARKPAGTSIPDMMPFMPDASPQAREFGRNYQHYAGENLRTLRDAATSQPVQDFGRDWRHFAEQDVNAVRDALTPGK